MGYSSEKMITDGELQQWEASQLSDVWQTIIDQCEKTLSHAGLDSSMLVQRIRLLEDFAERFLVDLHAESSAVVAPHAEGSNSLEAYLADSLANAIRLTIGSEAFRKYLDEQSEIDAAIMLAGLEGDEATHPDEG
jgi:hypothetical protein